MSYDYVQPVVLEHADIYSTGSQCYIHMRLSNHMDANHFAYPLNICAQMNSEYQVTKVFTLPSAEGDRMVEWTGTGKKFDRQKIHSSSEYHPDLQKDRRDTTTPYQVVQPDGPSFHIEGNLIKWEKWRLRVGFNYVNTKSTYNPLRTGTNSDSARVLPFMTLATMVEISFIGFPCPRCLSLTVILGVHIHARRPSTSATMVQE
jgi:Cu2+-containing amine oxidase